VCVYCVQPPVRQQARQAIIDLFAHHATKQNTKRTYQTHVNTASTICRNNGIDFSRPLSEDDLCLIISLFVASGHKVTTLKGFVSALQRYSLQQWSQPLPRHHRYNDVQAGLFNYYGDTNVSQPKVAFTLADLSAISSLLLPSTFQDAHDLCACLFAFFGLLRINEYMNSGLRWGGVRVTPDGVEITVPFSKTSLVPAVVSISSRTDSLCPTQAFLAYRAFFNSFALPQRPTDPLFITCLPSGYIPSTDTEFLNRIRRLVGRAFPGRDVSNYAGHSFRRGGASALKLAGVADSVIQRHGRWTSDAFLAYLDLQHNPAMRLLATRAIPSSSSSSFPSSSSSSPSLSRC
jgi:integrase